MTRADSAAADAVSAFLDYDAQQRPEEARFARLLLDDGGRVVSTMEEAADGEHLEN
ncbi:hypothetical protein [Leifsonia aquatica]|uniref:hypothetical protein n=1 Tax=Leifsonia aquatica TaxID=144185 RepID=UPI0028B1E0FB|nr:hypothetical protein [Leifsonia aquatica]